MRHRWIQHLNRARTRLVAAIVLALSLNGMESTGSIEIKERRLDAGFGGAQDEPPQHDWLLLRGKHWQIVSTETEDLDGADAIEQGEGDCPRGMIQVRGQMKGAKRGRSVESLQSAACSYWIRDVFPEQCGRFDEELWLGWLSSLPERPMSFCIDRYEYPNVKGQYPWILVTWNEAVDLCREQGKRLCSEDEWTFACEGEAAWPYPYGFTRSSENCVIDRPWRTVDPRAWADRTSHEAMLELDRLWQGEASGSRPLCVSPFGVYDMTGNVDEWTQTVSSRGYRSILKGGYWGEVRNRCRPSTRAHGENAASYEIGFRCCADTP